MYYTEYAEAAREHYESCRTMFTQCFDSKTDEDKYDCTKDILYRIYYLCGHIVECAAIYLIYKHYRWEENNDVKDWKGEKEDIGNLRRYNKAFTQKSHMDFFPIKIDKDNVYSCRRTCKTTNLDGMVEYPPVLFCKSNFGEIKEDYFNVHSHDFQGYIKGIIRSQIPTGVPYLENPDNNPECSLAINLLDNWSTDLRYYYENRKSGHYLKNKLMPPPPPVDKESISQLIKVCGEIVSLMPYSKNSLKYK